MTVWRIHLKPNGKQQGICDQDTFQFCIEDKIAGVGWGQMHGYWIDECPDDLISIVVHDNVDKIDNPTSATYAMKAMHRIKKGDLIWAKSNEKPWRYYLGQAESELVYFYRGPDKSLNKLPEDCKKYDICNFVIVKWKKIENEVDFLNNNLSPLFKGHTIAKICKEEVINRSKALWNQMPEK